MPPCAHAVEAPWPSGAAEITVTGRGASFSAQNSPARPPPTMTTSSVSRVRSWIMCRALHVVSRFARRWHQFFRLIIRSTERRAFSAIRGSIVTSSRR